MGGENKTPGCPRSPADGLLPTLTQTNALTHDAHPFDEHGVGAVMRAAETFALDFRCPLSFSPFSGSKRK
jgi:hypothetical protein